jgi:hypothetical protein
LDHQLAKEKMMATVQTVSPEKLELSTHDTDDAPVSRATDKYKALFEDVASNNETVLNRIHEDETSVVSSSTEKDQVPEKLPVL